MLPVWFVASRKVEKAFKINRLPLLALGAAFSFVVMMFNVPGSLPPARWRRRLR
jgi:cobalt/nickel transport system permease protein